MNLTMLIARSAGQVCVRFTARLLFTLQELAFTRQINSYAHLWTTRGKKSINARVIHMLDSHGMLSCKSPSRAHRKPLRRIACGVAVALVGALCLPSEASNGDIKQPKDVMQLADIQLTEKQEYCHNLIAFKESSNNRYAVNGSHYGYYQGRSKALKGAPDDYQFYWYWSYVSHRYGITQYDEPDYCKALHHLRVKGWQ